MGLPLNIEETKLAEQAEYPFEEYTLYKVFHKKEGRMMAQLVNGNVSRTTMSYARYLMSVHLKRVLGKDEHVDHLNDDKTDDRIDNFQLLTPLENSKKYSEANPPTYVEFVCPICNIVFKKTRQKAWNKKSPCCSKECGYKKVSQTLTGRTRKVL